MVKGVKISADPSFYEYMEKQRKSLQAKGIRNVSQVNLTRMIAQNLNQKRRGMGLMKNGNKGYKKKTKR